MPIRQAYLNDMIPSQQRATVLSFDSLMGSSGGVVIQPVLGQGGRRVELRHLVRLRRALPVAAPCRSSSGAGTRAPPADRAVSLAEPTEPAATRDALAQSTESRSTTNTSGSCGAITFPAPRAP